LPRNCLEALYPEQSFVRTSENGPETPGKLFELLEQDRERGYAVSESFYQPGVSAVAYPLRDRDGSVLASVNVMAPRHNLPDEMRTMLRHEVSLAAHEIERFLQVAH
jgi:DNA-binding IclR family transcriptional regulator